MYGGNDLKFGERGQKIRTLILYEEF